MHYYKRNIGDYHKKAGRLSMLEHGAYTLLIDACYDRERFPTEDDAIDWCWARSEEEVTAVRFVLSKFFTLDGGVYVQQRISEEVGAYKEMAIKNKEIAENREKAKKEGKNANITKRAPVVNEPPPNQEPLTKNQEPKEDQNQDQKTLPQPRASTGLGAEFDGIDFTFSDQQLLKWQEAYPKTDVESEIKKAAVWAAANPNKEKKNWARFLNTWIAKVEQAKGPLEGSCPVDKIIDLYHRLCPAFSPVAVTADKALRAAVVERWNESEDHQKSPFWVAFFKKAGNKASVFYRGENVIPRLEALMSRAIFRDIEESA